VTRNLYLWLMLPLAPGCSSGPPHFDCLNVVVEEGANTAYAIDELRDLPARSFVLRLDSAEITTRVLSGRRLGVLASVPEINQVPAGTWQPSAPDSLIAVWWGGFDGVRLEFAWNVNRYEGRGVQRDDGGCPGSDYCYEGPVTATPVACPAGPWLQADSGGWIPWRDR